MTSLESTKTSQTFPNPSSINKKRGGKLKKFNCPQNVGEGEEESFKIVSKTVIFSRF